MGLSVFDQPYALVTLEEAKVGLGEEGDYRNTLIDGMIMAAQGEMDGPKGWLGISIALQGIEYVVDDFSDPICLPAGPAIDPVDVRYIDSDGAEQVLDAGVFELLPSGKLALVSGQAWPTVSTQEQSVRVRYYAGIEDSFDPRIAIMKTAIILHVRMTLDGVGRADVRRAIEGMVAPLWVARC